MTIMRSHMPLVLQPGFQVAQLIGSGKNTVTDVHTAYKDQIDRVNPAVNALIAHNFSTPQAKLLQLAQANPEATQSMPLWGMPSVIKGCVPVANFPDTKAGTVKNGPIAKESAPIVQRLSITGAIACMLANLPPRSSSFTTHNASPPGAGFGTTHNPYNLDHTSYGSSGGVAAAVASGMAALGLGFSIAGSVQLPAHGCGVYALTLSPNIASSAGHFPSSETVRHMAVPGLFARHPKDLSIGLSAIQGVDNSPHQLRRRNLNIIEPRNPKDTRIGVAKGLGELSADEDTSRLLDELIDKLTQQGYQVSDFNFGKTIAEEIWYVSGGLFSAQVGPSMGIIGRFFFKYMSGLKESASDWAYYRGLLENLGGDSFRNYMDLMHRRDYLLNERDKMFGQYDYVIMPSAISAAPEEPLDSKTVVVNGDKLPIAVGLGAFGTIGNLLGVPVASIPIGHSEQGLPIGIQMLGRPLDDANLLDTVTQMVNSNTVPEWQPAEWILDAAAS